MAWSHKAGVGVHQLVNKLMEHSYPNLAAAGVTVSVHMAYAPKDKKTGEPKGRPLKVRGREMDYKVRIMPQDDRADGCADVRIYLDGEEWPNWTDRKQEAILDGAINRLDLVLDPEGNIKTDDGFRPCLRLKNGDIFCDADSRMVRKYGDDSPETLQVKDAVAMMQAAFNEDRG